jgi:hypothetical protein
MSHHHNHEHKQGHGPSACHKSPETLAYQLWEQAGCPEGQAARFWGEAEEQIKRSPQPSDGDLHLHHKGHGNAH